MTAKPKNIQGTLIDDEDLSADLADLVPVASKITDAAATYIAKLDKKYADDNIHGGTLRVLDKTQELAQEAVRIGAAIGRLLRTPAASLTLLRDKDDDKTATLTAGDIENTADHE